MFRMRNLNKGTRMIALLGFIIGGFSYGVVVGTYEIFPFQQIRFIKTMIPSDDAPDDAPVVTNLTLLKKHIYNGLAASNLIGSGGGAITRLGSQIVGVDREAKFFLYLGSGETRPLNVSLKTNKNEFLDFLGREISSSTTRRRAIQRFRVMDIDAQYVGGRVHLYVSHHYWHTNKNANSMRVSRLVLNGISELEDRFQVDEKQWETIYESHPFLVGSPSGDGPLEYILGLASGGRMVLLNERRLLVGVGDYGFDGFNQPLLTSQDPTSSYGKIISIDLIDLSAENYAYGFRNPQGLLKDSEGRIWETEHGPRGGDELNLIEEGLHYGWPFETYGTSYSDTPGFRFDWPQNKHNGQHPLYQRPVFAWVPSIGISALIQIQDPESVWTGDLLVSSLGAGKLYRVKIREGRVILTEPISIKQRIRDLVEMENGNILLWTDSAQFIELETIVEEGSELAKIAKREGIEDLVKMCIECHSFEPGGSNELKASLWGVYGREIGVSAFEGYSQELRERGGVWTDRALVSFIQDPQSFAADSTMPNLGITDSEARTLVNLLREMH